MKTTHQGKLGHYEVSFRMLPKNNEFEVLVENIQTFDKYRTIIDQRLIQNPGRLFEETFSSLQDLFNFLTQNFQEIQVGDGFMTFVYGVINKIPKKVSLQLTKEEEDRVEQAHYKIDKMQQEIRAKRNNYSLNRKLIIFLLVITASACYYHQNKVQQLEQRIQKLTENLRDYQQKYTEFVYSQNLKWQSFELILQKRLKKEGRQRQKQRKGLDNCSKSYFQLLNKFQQTERSLQSRLAKIQGNSTRIDHFGHHQNNSHKEHFTITPVSATSIKLSKKSSGFYNFVNKEKIAAEKQTKYTVKLTKKLSSSVTIGFTTQKGLGVIDNYGSSESVYYDTKRSGFMWIEGKSQEISSGGAAQGDTIECIADLTEGKFSWWKTGMKLYECDIPASMKGKPLFFSIQSPNIEDQLDISV